jgi:hypothetical protein
LSFLCLPASFHRSNNIQDFCGTVTTTVWVWWPGRWEPAKQALKLLQPCVPLADGCGSNMVAGSSNPTPYSLELYGVTRATPTNPSNFAPLFVQMRVPHPYSSPTPQVLQPIS